MRRLLLHSGSPCCRQRPDWAVGHSGDAWAAVDISERFPLRLPWWSVEGRWQPPRVLTVHVLIAGTWLDGLPSGPAEVAGQLCARLMEAYDLGTPRAHYAQGRCDSPGGLALPVPPGDCPPWAWWGEVAEAACAAERERIRRPLDRRWLREGMGGGG